MTFPRTFGSRGQLFGLLLGLAAATPAHAQLVAFPGAEGFGRLATGGRGGKVVEVTTLADAGPGSFREAFAQHPGEPITIVFRVGGLIELKSALKPTRSNVTIAGQTAPGDGICLKNYSLKLHGTNIIVRYLRSRPGNTSGANVSGIYGLNMENCRNFIVDHCSFSWSIEEAATFYDNKYSTVQWCLVSESLNSSFNGKGDHGYAGVWGGQYASYHHNLIAHHHSRAIRFNGARAHDTTAVVDYRNNVIYNWGNMQAAYGNEIVIPKGSGQLNMVNNYYKGGPATPAARAAVIFDITQAYDAATPDRPVATVYAAGNYDAGHPAVTANNWKGIRLHYYPETAANFARFRQAAETPNLAPISTQPAEAAYHAVLADAGATVPVRDAVDARIVEETRTGKATGSSPAGSATYGLHQGIIDSQEDVGGWPAYKDGPAPADADHDGMPDAWEKAHGLNPADASDRNGAGTGGYTHLEEYLNSLASSSEQHASAQPARKRRGR
jgi:hypothetical protein